MPDEFRGKENFRTGDEWLSTGGAAGASGVDSPPAISSLTPATAVHGVATTITVAGTFLSDVTTVTWRVGASGASGVATPQIDGPTKLIFSANVAAAGTYDVTATSPDGTSATGAGSVLTVT